MPNFGSEINQRKYRATWTPVLVGSPLEKNALYFGTQHVMKIRKLIVERSAGLN